MIHVIHIAARRIHNSNQLVQLYLTLDGKEIINFDNSPSGNYNADTMYRIHNIQIPFGSNWYFKKYLKVNAKLCCIYDKLDPLLSWINQKCVGDELEGFKENNDA